MGPRTLLQRSLPAFFAEAGHLDELVELAAAAGVDADKARQRMVEALLDGLDRDALDGLCAGLRSDPRLSSAVMAWGDPTDLPIDRELWGLAVSLVSGPGDGRLGVDDAHTLFEKLDEDGVYSEEEKRTLYWIREEMTWTEAGDRTFRQLVRKAASRRRASRGEAPAPRDDEALDASGVLDGLGVSGLTLRAADDEIARQETLGGPSFPAALRAALVSFLHDVDDLESPLALLANDAPDGVTFTDAYTPRDFVRERLDSAASTLDLVPVAADAHRESGFSSDYTGPFGPEQGEPVAKNWAFLLRLDSFGGTLFWAIVPRDGARAYNYGFS